MADEPDPPRKFYELKPKEFELLNGPVSAFTPQARPTESTEETRRIDVRELYKQANTPGPILQKSRPPMVNEVHAILADNLARANAAGLNTLAPKPKRRSRRMRDYLLVMIPLNAFFGFAAFGPYANAVSFVYGLGGMAFSTVAVTWVMFFIVEDY
jgi:hypothetical protein